MADQASRVLIRRATIEDLPTCTQILHTVVPLMNQAGNFQWDDTYPLPDTLAADIRRNHFWVAVLPEDATVCGFAALTMDQSPEYADCGWYFPIPLPNDCNVASFDLMPVCSVIRMRRDVSVEAIVPHRVAVSPLARGRGVASAFFAQAEALARVRLNAFGGEYFVHICMCAVGMAGMGMSCRAASAGHMGAHATTCLSGRVCACFVCQEHGCMRVRVDTNTQNTAMRAVIDKQGGFLYAGDISLTGKRPGLRFACFEKVLQ